jgi:hypothetical protein
MTRLLTNDRCRWFGGLVVRVPGTCGGMSADVFADLMGGVS